MNIENDEELLIYRLTNSNSEYVYNWLKENAPSKENKYTSPNTEELEQALIKRNEPIINLGLALYGHEGNTGYSLYKSGDETIKKAALAGSTLKNAILTNWIQDKGVIKELLKENNQAFYYACFSNKDIGYKLLEDLYQKEGDFKEIDDDTWRILIHYTGFNEAIATPYDDSYMDGYAEYSYGKKFGYAWELFNKVPVNDDWANVLLQLSDKLRTDSVYNFDVEAALKRWEKDEGEYNYYNLYAGCRINLCKCYRTYNDEFKALKNSSDTARRQGYYARFEPDSKDEIVECFKKDQKDFLDVAITNNSLWYSMEYREALKNCCWEYKDPNDKMGLSNLDYPNTFKYRDTFLRKNNPSWFNDEADKDEADDEFSEIRTRLDSIEEKLNDDEFSEIRTRLDSIEEKLNDLARRPRGLFR